MENVRKLKSIIPVMIFVVLLFIPMSLYANEINVTIDGQRVNFADQGPIIVDGRTLVPVRGVFEALGFDVSWNQDTQTATLISANHEVVITVSSAAFTTNGINHALDVPAQIIGGRTMLPIRAVVESVGYYVDWDGAMNTVIINTTPIVASVNQGISEYGRSMAEEFLSQFWPIFSAFESNEFMRSFDADLHGIYWEQGMYGQRFVFVDPSTDERMYTSDHPPYIFHGGWWSGIASSFFLTDLNSDGIPEIWIWILSFESAGGAFNLYHYQSGEFVSAGITGWVSHFYRDTQGNIILPQHGSDHIGASYLRIENGSLEIEPMFIDDFNRRVIFSYPHYFMEQGNRVVYLVDNSWFMEIMQSPQGFASVDIENIPGERLTPFNPQLIELQERMTEAITQRLRLEGRIQ